MSRPPKDLSSRIQTLEERLREENSSRDIIDPSPNSSGMDTGRRPNSTPKTSQRRNLQLPIVQQSPPPPKEQEIRNKLKKIMERNGKLIINQQEYQTETKDLEDLGDLGNGTSGHVVKMRHKLTETICAVKQMRRTGNDEENKRILMDIDVVLKSDNCPYIVHCLGCFISDAEVWICMELMATCFDKLLKKSNKPVPESILGKVTVATVKALSYLKDTHGVIHRDIKPSNILVDELGNIKLCDFGISGRLVDSKAKTRSAGCAAYMAPERIDPKKRDYDIRADVWSLGITLVELATGSFPYKGCNTDFEVLTRVLESEPPSLPIDEGFSQEFQTFVRKCLIKDHNQRPKYPELLASDFIKKYEKCDVDVAAWLASVMNDSTTSQRRYSPNSLGYNNKNCLTPSIAPATIEISPTPELSLSSIVQPKLPTTFTTNDALVSSTILTTTSGITKTTQNLDYQNKYKISDNLYKNCYDSDLISSDQQLNRYKQTSCTSVLPSSPRLHSPYTSNSTSFQYDNSPPKSMSHVPGPQASCSSTAQYISQIQNNLQPLITNEYLSNARFSPVNLETESSHKKLSNTSYDAGHSSLSSSPLTTRSRLNSPQPVRYTTSNTLDRTNSTKRNDSSMLRSYLNTQQNNNSYLYQQQLYHMQQTHQLNQFDNLDRQFNDMNIHANVTDNKSETPVNQLYTVPVSINARNANNAINDSNTNEYNNLNLERDIVYKKIAREPSLNQNKSISPFPQRTLLTQQQQQQQMEREHQYYQHHQKLNECQPHWKPKPQNIEYYPQHAENYRQYQYGGSSSATASPNLGPRKNFSRMDMENQYVGFQGNTSPIVLQRFYHQQSQLREKELDRQNDLYTRPIESFQRSNQYANQQQTLYGRSKIPVFDPKSSTLQLTSAKSIQRYEPNESICSPPLRPTSSKAIYANISNPNSSGNVNHSSKGNGYREEPGWFSSLAGVVKRRFASYVKSHLASNESHKNHHHCERNGDEHIQFKHYHPEMEHQAYQQSPYRFERFRSGQTVAPMTQPTGVSSLGSASLPSSPHYGRLAAHMQNDKLNMLQSSHGQQISGIDRRHRSPDPPPRFNRGQSPLLLRRNLLEYGNQQVDPSPILPRRYASPPLLPLMMIHKGSESVPGSPQHPRVRTQYTPEPRRRMYRTINQ